MARTTCIYGPTGSRKTTQIKYLARYTYARTGKSTLLLSTDGGGWDPCEPEILAGIILPYHVESSVLPLILLRKISQGYWPRDPRQTDPSRIVLDPINFTKVGAIAVEGWSSICQAIMRYLPDRGISVGGEDRNKLGGFNQSVQVGEVGQWQREDFRSNTRGDYGFVQNHLYGLVSNFNSLPVDDILYTAHESKGEDEDRSSTYGPRTAGKALVAQCGSWVGNLIHAQDYAVNTEVEVPDPAEPGKKIKQPLVETTVRFYFKKHPDPATGILFPAKPRLTPEKLRDMDRRFPGGYFEPSQDGRDTFADYLETLDTLSSGQGDQMKSWRDKMDQKLGRKVAPAAPAPEPAAPAAVPKPATAKSN